MDCIIGYFEKKINTISIFSIVFYVSKILRILKNRSKIPKYYPFFMKIWFFSAKCYVNITYFWKWSFSWNNISRCMRLLPVFETICKLKYANKWVLKSNRVKTNRVMEFVRYEMHHGKCLRSPVFANIWDILAEASKVPNPQS